MQISPVFSKWIYQNKDNLNAAAADRSGLQKQQQAVAFFLLRLRLPLPPQVPNSDRVPSGGVQNSSVRIESNLVDLVLSSWDGDGATAGGGADVADVDLARGAEGRECGGGVTPKITLGDEHISLVNLTQKNP